MDHGFSKKSLRSVDVKVDDDGSVSIEVDLKGSKLSEKDRKFLEGISGKPVEEVLEALGPECLRNISEKIEEDAEGEKT